MRARGAVIGGVVAALAVALAGAWAIAGPEGTLNPGESFPAWSMPDHTGATVASKDLAGKTYLMWYYPRALTSGCTAEGCALRDSYAEFKRLGVEVLGVSFDAPEKNAEFVKENGFPFRLLSDRDKSVAISVGAADSDKRLFARRISYLVGPDGKILKVYLKVDPAVHARQVLDDLATLR
jgi:thioredoxin-dependent peroxiredoxin